jgi:hypothetical protein
VGRAARPTVGRQEKDGGEGVRHLAAETGAVVQAWGKSWEDKAVAHKERDTARVEAWDRDNTDPEDGQRCKRLHSDKRGSTCKE